MIFSLNSLEEHVSRAQLKNYAKGYIIAQKGFISGVKIGGWKYWFVTLVFSYPCLYLFHKFTQTWDDPDTHRNYEYFHVDLYSNIDFKFLAISFFIWLILVLLLRYIIDTYIIFSKICFVPNSSKFIFFV